MTDLTPSASDQPRVLVIVAHPAMEHSRVNRALLRSAKSLLAQDATGHIEVRNLYRLYPDYLIDVEAEKAALARATLVVWQHPIHWYSMPALMKLWVDDVLTFGWAYGPGGTALHGKDLWLVATTGGPQESYRPDSYNPYFFDPYEQTAAVCGMRFLPPMLFHGAHRVGPEKVAEHAAIYTQRLASYPEWPELADVHEFAGCDVPQDARPAEEPVEKAA